VLGDGGGVVGKATEGMVGVGGAFWTSEAEDLPSTMEDSGEADAMPAAVVWAILSTDAALGEMTALAGDATGSGGVSSAG